MGSLLGLTSPVLRDVVIVVAVVAPIALGGAAWWRLRGRRPRRRMTLTLAVVGGCVMAQLAAVLAVGMTVNDSFGFYSSYGDLTGSGHQPEPIRVDTIGSAAGGNVRAITIHGHASHTTAQALAWLPPQYDEPRYADYKFPLVEFLPGQPAQPGPTFERFDLADAAEHLIESGQVRPFVIVVPPLMIRPPWDTECTNVPHGPQAMDWLTTDLPAGITSQLRVQPPGRHWSLMGFSTGGFCAAKLLLERPGQYHAAVGLGAYYQPTTKRTYPHLFGGSMRLRRANSPVSLYHRRGLHGDHLLLIAGRDDPDAYAATRTMLSSAADDPNVDDALFGNGGHNISDYARYVEPAYAWLHRVGAL